MALPYLWRHTQITPEPVFVNVNGAQEPIPRNRIDSEESIPPAYVAWRAGYDQ